MVPTVMIQSLAPLHLPAAVVGHQIQLKMVQTVVLVAALQQKEQRHLIRGMEIHHQLHHRKAITAAILLTLEIMVLVVVVEPVLLVVMEHLQLAGMVAQDPHPQ